MDDDYDQKPYEDDSRGYRERSPRGENGGSRARSASPSARDRMDTRGPPPPLPADDEEEAQNSGTNLFVTGIHPRLTEEDVTRLFEKYGEVEKCNIMRDPHTRDSRGFGFVNMASGHEADAAKEGLQGEVYEGRTLSIEKARRAKPRQPTPGKYFGPPKREDFGRRGPPRGRYGGGDSYGGGYGGGRRDDRYSSGGRYDRDDRSSYRQRDRYDDRPPRDRGGARGDDRYSSRRGGGGRDFYESRGPPGGDAGGRYVEPAGDRGYDGDRADDRYSGR